MAMLFFLLLHAQAFGQSELSLFHDGETRTALVYRPKVIRQPLPLIISMHGGGGSAEGQLVTDQLGHTAKAQGSFIVVYPTGSAPSAVGKGRTWNAGDCCGKSVEENADDVGYLDKLLAKLLKSQPIDPKRVYLTGFSNGAMMAHKYACERTDKIRALATVGGVGVFQECKRSKPLPLLHLHGTLDKCAPFGGGLRGDCVHDFIERWLGVELPRPKPAQQQSARQHVDSYLVDYKPALRKAVTSRGFPMMCEAYLAGSKEQVVFCPLKDGGHTWSGGTYGKPCEDGAWTKKCKAFKESSGPLLNHPNATDSIMRFFSVHQ